MICGLAWLPGDDPGDHFAKRRPKLEFIRDLGECAFRAPSRLSTQPLAPVAKTGTLGSQQLHIPLK